MKSPALAIMLLMFLIISLAVVSLFNSVTANPSPQLLPKVTVTSPTGVSNSSNVALSITVTAYGRFLYGSEFYIEGIQSLTYSVDRTLQQQNDIPITLTKISSSSEPEDRYIGNTTLPNLSDGTHSLTIQGKTTAPFNNTIYEFLYFTIDTKAPVVAIRSPENRTYNSIELQLNYFVNEQSNVSYIFDGQPESLVAGNMTLHKLTYGHHKLTVYAVDDAGNKVSESAIFTISEEIEPEPTSQPIDALSVDSAVIIVAVFAVTVVIVAGIGLFYYRSRRAKSQTVT